ncbi:hypothetical protein DAEQUDRAFT_688311 [Daedalea quercina L-15889]|uniref:G-protein coupled receptors family 1 profile domain-containing protein n=1 Tax=Daedalea quercina L-15889 TaxID=1314783 RepID=A0A165RME3_9APHY|nr:hypothetical protein DAEQUDRAFT_688311 [Daedalea quercina L-15889]
MREITIAEAQLTALFMQSVTYGVHMVTFAACMYTWLHRSPTASKSWVWMVTAVALFGIGTCDVAFNLYHNIMAFILYMGPGGANAVFDHSSNWVNVMRSVWLYLSALISDAVLIYRCWIVYANVRHRAIMGIATILLWLACVSFAIAIIYYLSTVGAYASIPMIPELRPFQEAFFVTTLMVNLITTGLIIRRLWKVHKCTASAFTRSRRLQTRLGYGKIILIFIESALLYTATIVVCVVVVFAGSIAAYGVTDVALEVAGIAFDLITIRIWMGVSTEQTQAFANTVTTRHSRTVKTGLSHGVHAESAPTDSTDANTLELQVVVSPDDVVEWHAKDGKP